MIPKRVFNPPLAIKSLTSENRLKGQRRQLDWDLPSSCTGTIKRHPPSLDLDKEIVSPIDCDIANETKNNDKEHKIGGEDDDVSGEHDNDKSHGNSTRSNCLKWNSSNAIQVESNLIPTTQEIVALQGNNRCKINVNNEEGNKTTHDVEQIELPAKKCVETTINNVPLRTVINRKISKLKLSNQLLLASSKSTLVKTASSTTTTPLTPRDANKTKRLLLRESKNSESEKNDGKKALLNNEPIIICMVDKSQVKNSKENAVVVSVCSDEPTDEIKNSEQHLQQQSPTKQKQLSNVSTATALHAKRIKNEKAENKYKINEGGKNKNKILLRKFIVDDDDLTEATTTTISVVAPPKPNDSITSKNYFSNKRLPLGNRLKSQDFATLSTTSTGPTPAITFTELYRDFPVNYTSTTVVENIPLKPPPYRNPPSPPPPIQLLQPSPSIPTSSARPYMPSIVSSLLCKQTHRFPFESRNKPLKKLHENEIKNTRVDFGDETEEYSVPYVLSPTNSSSNKLITNAPTSKAIAADSTADSPAHRIANELRLRGNFALQKLTNISKLNGKNNRRFLLLKAPSNNEFETVTKSSHQPRRSNSNKKNAFNKHENPIAADERENLNETFFFDYIRQSVDIKPNDCNNIDSNSVNSTDTMDLKMPSNTSPCDILAKPEFSSSLFQNIPVRPRKGVPHLENYCLFDPSKDFVNEKELKKKYGLLNGDCMPFPIKMLDKHSDNEFIEEIIYEDHLLYDTLEDVVEEDEEGSNFANYFTIDPDYIEHQKVEPFANTNHLQPIVESDAEDVYSTDLSDSNANLNQQNGREKTSMINHPLPLPGNRTPLKKSPQIDKLFRQSVLWPAATKTVAPAVATSVHKAMTNSRSKPPSKNESSTVKSKSDNTFVKQKTRTSPPSDLPLRTNNHHKLTPNLQRTKMTTKESTSKNGTLKHSVSTPQLNLKNQLADSGALPSSVEAANKIIGFQATSTQPNGRSMQYKMRHARPLSQNSDADSGFLSPITPPPPEAFHQSITTSSVTTDTANSNASTVLVLHQCDTIQGYIELYTNWANHYLDKVKSKRRVTDLAVDCRDGLLLADVIEGVTSVKVPDLIKKPKTQQQMFDNVNNCLNTLHTLSVGGLDGITTNDLCSGRLRAILDIFYALSVYKQASKQQKPGGSTAIKQNQVQPSPQQIQQGQQPIQQNQQQAHLGQQPTAVNASNEMLNRQLPVPYGKTGLNGGGGTSIPLPATVLVTRRCPPDKVRPLPPTPGQTQIGAGLKGNGSCESSLGSSPQNGTPTHIAKGGSGLRQQTVCKIPASPYAMQNHIATNGGVLTNGIAATPTKHSMLDKLKLFNKEKSDRSSKTQISKRTSSSSGFSSARSERSDSSLSLNNDQCTAKSTAITATGASNLKKPEIVASKTKSKLLASSAKSSSKDTLNKKSDKKDKSPARTSADMTESKLVPPKSQKISTKTESKLKPISMTKKLDQRSESKTNLSQIIPLAVKSTQSSQVASPQTANTGIPKPMAAIKGTTKPPSITNALQQSQQKTEQYNDIKSDKLADISNQNNISNSQQDGAKMQIIAPILIENAANNHQIINHMHLQQALNQQNISMSDSCHSKSTHSSSAGQMSNSSESSIIYRPSSESGASDSMLSMRQNVSMSPPSKIMLTNRSKMERFGAGDQISGVMMMKTPSNGSIASSTSSSMTGCVAHSSANNNKFNTVPSKLIHSVNGIIYEEEKQMTIVPMRPLLRGYNSHLTLPTRGARGQHMVADYCDDIGQGYCSDGDALRKVPVRYADAENGYMSEGGVSSGNGLHHKPMPGLLRARTQLPTTIEERCRSSRGENLDSVGIRPHTMEINGSSRHHHHRQPLPPPPPSSQHQQQHQQEQQQQQQQHQHQPLLPPHMVNGNGTEHWIKLSDSHNRHDQGSLSPTPNRKDKNSPSHSRRSSSSKNPQNRAKSAPQAFGYIKRTNGSLPADVSQPTTTMMLGTSGGRTAHVSAVPRSGKMKVSGGTQTCTADLQTKIPPNTQHRSFSLTGTSAAQLSQSIRERLSNGSHSLPKPGSELHIFQHRMANRGSLKMTDGSLSDTQTYAEVKTDYSSYAMWLKHSNTATSRLSEGDSMENIGMGSPGTQRGGHKMMQREPPYTQSPRLNRSNSIRSTKSEKMYPSMLSRGPDVEIEPYYCLPVGTVPAALGGNSAASAGVKTTAVPWSQPTSPTPPSRFSGGPLSPTHAAYRLTYPKKNDEVHGSAASLLSGGSSLYGSTEERQANEVRRLKRELCDAREQVMSLSSQLSTNAHVVSAFEQSLTNMTQRLQQLSATAERKDGELTEMRQTIELLRKQSIQAGLTSAHIQSMGNEQSNNRLSTTNSIESTPSNGAASATLVPTTTATAASTTNLSMQRHLSSDSMCSLNSLSSGCSAQDKKKKTGWLRTSFKKAFSRNAKLSKTNRYVSAATTLEQIPSSHSICLNSTIESNASLPPPSPTKGSPHRMVPVVENAKPIDAIDEGNPLVEDLKKQLREKDLVLTDIRLEALSSASQLESLKDTVNKMRQEMMNLKQNNERLQKLVTSRSLAGSEVSLSNGGPASPNGSLGEPRRYSLADGNLRPPLELPQSLDETEEEDIPPAPAPDPEGPSKHGVDLSPTNSHLNGNTSDHLSTPAEEIPEDHIDGKKISIVVYLGQPESFNKYADEIQQSDDEYFSSSKINDIHENGFESKNKSFSMNSNQNEFIIAFTYISGKTTWQNLDYIVRKTFKDYLARIDPGTNLGLNTDSITSYHLGEAKRGPEIGFPELLPCGYIVGNVRSLYICLQGVGSLAFDSLIPRSIVHRYISLLTEHRRLILCGPSGTGKSYLARKLAEFLVTRSQRGNPTEAIATFNVDHKSSEELQHYLGHIAAQASMVNGASELPSVIILDNLHHASALGDVFQVLLSAGPAAKLPCIIGTMSQATCNTTNLQLHHNFRWVLTANHMEPVKGFLARFLRRRLYTLELSTHTSQSHLGSVFTWLPTVWQHINRFLETHSSSDVTIGPRLFLSCPLDLKDSQVWFTDVWNYHLAPYLVEAVREGVQLYGRRGGAWVDPVTFVRETYPWSLITGSNTIPPLRQINAEDVGLEGGIIGVTDSQDPLLNMLIRLQEAANYSGNPEQESDCASLDSNITADSSAGAE